MVGAGSARLRSESARARERAQQRFFDEKHIFLTQNRSKILQTTVRFCYNCVARAAIADSPRRFDGSAGRFRKYSTWSQHVGAVQCMCKGPWTYGAAF